MTLTQTVCLVVLSVIGATAAWLDIRYRIIPHWLCGLALVAGVAAVWATMGAGDAGSALLHAAIALVGGFLLFAAGVIGGGDAKYYAALATWFPLRDGPLMLVSVTLSGVVLLVVWLAWRRSRPRPESPAPKAEHAFAKLPYGVAISLGAVLSFSLLAGRGAG